MIALLLLTALAQPPDMDPDAAAHFRRGAAHYEAHEWAEAIAEFRAAFTIDPRRELLFAWAQAERLGGDCEAAMRLYDRFLATDPPPRQAEAAHAKRDECASRLPKPPPRTVIVVQTPPPPPPPPPPRPVAHWYGDVLGDALVVSGAIGLGIGAAYYASAASDVANARQAPNQLVFADRIAGVQDKRTLSWIGFGAGGALVGAGLLRFLLHHDVAVVADERSAQVVVGGRF